MVTLDPTLATRACAACGASLAGRSPRARTCGPACRKWLSRHGTPRAVPVGFICCPGCGAEFVPGRPRHRWCSPRCRMRGHRGQASRSAALAARWGIEARDFWRTPPWLFTQLDAELRFGLDAATAGPSDALCDRFLTPDNDALCCSWRAACDPARPAAFCNPPYSRKGGRGHGLLRWAEAAVRARDEGLTAALLLPPSPSTRYHRLLHKEAVELRMPDQRLAFLHPDTGVPTAGNRGDSMVAVLRPGQRGPAVTAYFSRRNP